MKYWVYILKSQTTDRFYCGHTDDLNHRINQHNNPDYNFTRTTKVIKGPWEIVWTAECPSRSEAMRLEKSIKKREIGRFLKKLELAESHRKRRD